MAVSIAEPTAGTLQIAGAVVLCTLDGGVVTPVTSVGLLPANNLSDLSNRATAIGNLAAATLVGIPIIVSVKSLTVLTSGTPADIGTIAVPSGITRYVVAFGSATTSGCARCIAETAAGTLAGALFVVRDTASGGGTAVTGNITGPASAGLATNGAVASPLTVLTSPTLHINQIANSANAGTCSFYVLIYPIN